MSDGQHRQVISPPATLATSGFTYNITQVPSGIVWDMEQGDLDGDGDLDEVYIGTPPGSWTIATINHPAGVASRADSVFTAVGFTAISGEIADLNDDGIMDLVVVGVSPSVFPNLSMEAFLNSDINTNGIPGGAPVQVNWDPAFADFPMSAVDVETGDLNGDGLMDVYVACGSLLCEDSVAQPNRMFFGNITALGVYELNEATANFIANPIDDSRDCEMFDYEGDGDLDLVVANSGGGAGASFGSSVNLIHINNGAGLFATMVVPGTPAESSDVLAVDIDQNGFADLYFGNFAVPEDDLCVYSSIVPDQFLLNSGGTLVDATGLIPDNNWASVDVEAVSLPSGAAQSLGLSRRDYDGDGDVDIFIGLGSGVSFAAPLFPAVNGVNSGIVILINQMVEQGVAPGGVLPDFVVDTTTLQNMEVRDLEFGSWFVPGGGPNIDRWFEKDLGVGSFGFGAWALTKNP